MKFAGRLGLAVAALMAAGCVSHIAQAQTDDYPSKPIRLIIPFSAGGPADIVGRVFADRASVELKQPMIPDNRPGANSAIGAQLAAHTKPDGYTVMLGAGATISVLNFLKDKPYDIEKDFVPVAFVGGVPNVLVVPGNSNIKSIPDLVALAKNTPGGLNYGSGGNGSLAHLSSVLLADSLKINATHVPYKGNAQAIQDVAAGRLQFMFATPLESVGLAKNGDIRMIAITSATRLPSLPDVPTTKELGFPQIDPSIWSGFYVPANTPAPIVDRLYKAFAAAAADPAVQAKLGSLSMQVQVLDSPAFAKFIHSEVVRWKKVIEDNNIKVDE